MIKSKPGSGFYELSQLFENNSLQNMTLKGYGATLKMHRDLFTNGKISSPRFRLDSWVDFGGTIPVELALRR